MAGILGHWRIFAASLFSIVLICGAYVLARGIGSPRLAEASTETELLKAIATRDTDNDGLPDWEESLYGTDPRIADTKNLGMTDGAAVKKGLIVPIAVAASPAASTTAPSAPILGAPPAASEGSLTDAFARSFFTLYVSAKQANGGADLTADEISALADQAIAVLASNVSAAPDYKTKADFKVSGTGPTALLEYAASAESVMKVFAPNLPKSELIYLQDALNGDATAFTHIETLADAYQNVAKGLAVLPVPQELVDTHLKLVNAMKRISGAARDFARVNSDPMLTMLALKQYPQAVVDLAGAFQAIDTTYKSQHVTIEEGQPGAFFVGVYAKVQAKSLATSTPDGGTTRAVPAPSSL